MDQKKQSEGKSNAKCQVEAVVSFDERGQLVLPKDVRNKFKIEPGNKLALISCTENDQSLCCFTLIPVDTLQGMVKEFLGPVFKEMF